MDTVLQGIPHVISCIDEEHLHNLARVFKCLTHYDFILKMDKCEFLMDGLEILGHKIDTEGLHVLPDKVESFGSAPEPQNIQELRSFSWTATYKHAFSEAKNALMSASILGYYDPSLLPMPAGDASAYGIGAVISHRYPDSTERPIVFVSCSLSN